MTRIKIVFALVGLLAATVATAALEPITEVLELAASDVRVPANEASRIKVVPCEGCEARTVRVNGNTIYRVGVKGQPVTLREFRAAAADAQSDELGLIYVTYSVDNGVVTELVVQQRQSQGIE